MKGTDVQVQIARIEAGRYVGVALIGALATLATGAAVEWIKSRGPGQPPVGTTAPAATVPSGAPEIYFDIRPFDRPPEQCVEQAKGSLERTGLRGRVVSEYSAWGYQGRTTGLIWCKADEERVLFVAAGPDAKACEQVVQELTRNF